MRYRTYVDYFVGIALTVSVGVFIVVAAVVSSIHVVTVSGISMEHTLRDGDRIVCARTDGGLGSPLIRRYLLKKGRVVVLRDLLLGRGFIVKRIVGTAGDHLRITHGDLIVNGQIQQDAPTIARSFDSWPMGNRFGGNNTGSIVVSSGSYYVLSDNRSSGLDSRAFGPVAANDVVSVVVAILPRRDH